MRDLARRCWWPAVAAMVCLLVWQWPRGDSRFVGTWSITFDGDTAPPEAKLTLHANGAGHLSNDDGARYFFRWHTGGGKLVVGPGSKRFPSRPIQWLGRGMMDLTGHTFLLSDLEFDVVDIERDRIAVQFDDQAGALNRLAE